MNSRRIIAALILIFTLLQATAHIERNDHSPTVDSLRRGLSQAKRPVDSISYMWDLYDLLPRDSGTIHGFYLLDVADRAGRPDIALEMIRQLSNRYLRNDSTLRVLYERTFKYSDAKDKNREPGTIPADYDDIRETRAFVQLSRNIYQSKYSTPERRKELLQETLQRYTSNPPKDTYDKIVLLHSICSLLSMIGSSDMLPAYLDSMGVLVNTLPKSQVAIRNAYNVHAALSYAQNGQYDKAKKIDLQTLDNINYLAKNYKEQGRKFRNMDANRYIVYQRLLSLFPILTPAEINDYYKRAKEIVATDYTASTTYDDFKGPDIYYNLANKNYAKALTDIKDALPRPYNKGRKKELLRYEILCARELGDKATLLEASQEYIDELEKHINEKLEDNYRELQLLYSTYEMQNNYNRLQLEKKASESSAMSAIVFVSVGAVILLLIFVIILIRLNNKKKALVNTLDTSNRELRDERENLEKSRKELMVARDLAQKANNLKSDFIKNMSYEVKAPLKAIHEYSRLIVDCADASNHKYLERFTSLLELNSELLTTIIEDVLNISEIDSKSVPINNKATDLRNLSTMVLDGVRHRVSPNVSLQFDASSPSISLFTDPQKLHQILLNLLTNAAKFTPKGSITLGFKEEDDKVVFSVTDTGIGIKPDKKEVIFDRFVKLDHDTQGTGLGLTISRLIARMLGGDVELDTTYNKGARFILYLPKK